MIVLWADEHARGAWYPLRERLASIRAASNRVLTATSYEEASQAVGVLWREECKRPDLLVVDAILPHADGEVSLELYHGRRLAKKLAQTGIAEIVFLTLVPEKQLDLDALRAECPAVTVSCVDKLAMLCPEMNDAAFRLLRGGGSE